MASAASASNYESTIAMRLREIVQRARRAERDALEWAELVRQEAERRFGVGPTDEGVHEAPRYAAVDDRCVELRQLREAAERVLATWDAAAGRDRGDEG